MVDYPSDGGGGSGTDPNAIHKNVAGEIALITAKAAPTSSDFLLIEDAASANAKKSILLSALPSAKAYVSVTETSNEFTLNQENNQENFIGTITANATLKNFANPVVGTSGFFILTNDATGGYTLATDTWFETPDDAGITLNADPNGVTLIAYEVQAATKIRLDFASYAS